MAVVREVIKMKIIKDYIAHLDNKKRITLRGTAYQYYNVKEYENGSIVLEPRELTVPDGISDETLADIDCVVNNFKKGNISSGADL